MVGDESAEPSSASVGESRPSGRLSRLYAATRRTPSPRTQRVLLIVAALVFFVGGWYALRSLDVAFEDIRWVPLLVAGVVGVPLTQLANTFEYVLSARMLGHRVAFMPAVQLTTVATAANLLPIPGAFLVRVQGLRTMGSHYRGALASTAVIGLAWIGVSALLAAVLLAVSGSWVPAVILGAAGVPLLVVAHAWLTRAVPVRAERRRLAALILAVELFAVVTNAGRLVLILVALGVEASLGQALVLAVSSSLAAAAGILPGGFGLRELIAAALAPLVGLPASAGFAATAINRVIGIVVLAPVTVALALRSQPRSESADTVAETDRVA
ncbi:MAG TPA: hypothetical protein VK915_06505 [Gaiellaceae bacterium]|nr:hypothetical protein [Gaiellaceae bacterium]